MQHLGNIWQSRARPRGSRVGRGPCRVFPRSDARPGLLFSCDDVFWGMSEKLSFKRCLSGSKRAGAQPRWPTGTSPSLTAQQEKPLCRLLKSCA